MGDAGWAAEYAERLLSGMGDRWGHVVGVADAAIEVGTTLPEVEWEVLVAAAYLHDIGYAPGLVVTGFHPLDGGRHLRALGRERLACLVARHTCSGVEADLRGLTEELAVFPAEDSVTAAALTYCDVTTGPTGRTVSLAERVADVAERYGEDHVVTRGLRAALPSLRDTVARIESLCAAARGGQPI